MEILSLNLQRRRQDLFDFELYSVDGSSYVLLV